MYVLEENTDMDAVSAHSTWESIVLPLAVEKRACVFCGGLSEVSKKVTSIDHVLDILESQAQQVQEHPISSTLNNICSSAVAAHELFCRDKPSVGTGRRRKQQAVLCACHSCHHWVNRRFKLPNFLLPMQALSWYINTLVCITKKNLDHRVVFRLACVLSTNKDCDKHNYYRCLFSDQELVLFETIQSDTVHEVAPKVAAYHYARNGASMFLNSSKMVEYIRRGLNDEPDEDVIDTTRGVVYTLD